MWQFCVSCGKWISITESPPSHLGCCPLDLYFCDTCLYIMKEWLVKDNCSGCNKKLKK